TVPSPCRALYRRTAPSPSRSESKRFSKAPCPTVCPIGEKEGPLMTTYGALSAFPNPHRSASVAASRPDAVWADVARPGRTEDDSPYSLVDLLRARQAWMDEARCTGRS